MTSPQVPSEEEIEKALELARPARTFLLDDAGMFELIRGVCTLAAAYRAKCAELQKARTERDAWMRDAAQGYRNADFYRGLVCGIGEQFGEAAYISDDGSRQQEVLALKVPELVQQMRAELQKEREEKEMAVAAFSDGNKNLAEALRKAEAELQRIREDLAHEKECIKALGNSFDKMRARAQALSDALRECVEAYWNEGTVDSDMAIEKARSLLQEKP